MPTHIAMIRGINVSGHNSLSMQRLRDLFTGLGFGDVRTYIQSGNVLFDARGAQAKILSAIEAALLKELGSDVTVILRSPSDLAQALANNPFLKTKAADHSHLHVTFLNGLPAKPRIEALTTIAAGEDEFRLLGREIYLHCPGGYGRTKLSNTAIEKALALRATTRNWNTVAKLHAGATAG